MSENTVKPIDLQTTEDRIAAATAKYHLDQQGRAPKNLRATLVDDMVIVYSSGIYTSTEDNLSESEEGRKLVKSARRELRSLTRREIEGMIGHIVGREVLRSFWDLDIRSGEQIEVYMLAPCAAVSKI